MSSRSKEAEWHPLLAEDMAQVDAIADSIHTGLPERPDVFEEKRTLFPAGCWKFVINQTIVGYGLSHPWRLFDVPPLDEFLGELPSSANCLYIHDVAILPQVRGQRAAPRYIERISSQARMLGIPNLACVSVYGTDRLWARVGFETVSNEAIKAKLVSYGDSAKYMVAKI
ncbi:GNAT family N-acetyltransferase [Methylorubrum thiocyanatum]